MSYYSERGMLDIHVAFFKINLAEGTVDPMRIYRDARYFLMQESYVDEKYINFPETFFWQADSQHHGKEFWIWWRVAKEMSPHWKPTGVKKFFKINFHGHKLHQREIMHEGKKLKVHTGKLEIYVDAILRITPPKWGKDTPFKRAALDIFWKRIYRKNIEMFRKEVLDDSYKFQAYFKKIFKMESFTPKMKFATPEYGLPNTQD